MVECFLQMLWKLDPFDGSSFVAQELAREYFTKWNRRSNSCSSIKISLSATYEHCQDCSVNWQNNLFLTFFSLDYLETTCCLSYERELYDHLFFFFPWMLHRACGWRNVKHRLTCGDPCAICLESKCTVAAEGTQFSKWMWNIALVTANLFSLVTLYMIRRVSYY